MRHHWDESDLEKGLYTLRHISTLATAVYIHTGNVQYGAVAGLVRAAEAIAQQGLTVLSQHEATMQVIGWVEAVSSAFSLEPAFTVPAKLKPFDLRELTKRIPLGYEEHLARRFRVSPHFEHWSHRDYQEFLSLLLSTVDTFTLPNEVRDDVSSYEAVDAAKRIEVILRSAVYLLNSRSPEPDWSYFSRKINPILRGYGVQINS